MDEPDEKAYVLPPEGFCRPGMCGKLRRWLNGMRPAASAWKREYATKLEGIGFVRGISASTVFYNAANKLRCVVHGDDFTFLGFEEDLLQVAANMKEWYELKIRGIVGGESDDLLEISILNRKLKWVGNQMTYEADMKHAEIICDEMGLHQSSNGLSKPVVKETLADIEDPENNEELQMPEDRRYRATGARTNYLSSDRIDLQFAANQACRSTSKPTNGELEALEEASQI